MMFGQQLRQQQPNRLQPIQDRAAAIRNSSRLPYPDRILLAAEYQAAAQQQLAARTGSLLYQLAADSSQAIADRIRQQLQGRLQGSQDQQLQPTDKLKGQYGQA